MDPSAELQAKVQKLNDAIKQKADELGLQFSLEKNDGTGAPFATASGLLGYTNGKLRAQYQFLVTEK